MVHFKISSFLKSSAIAGLALTLSLATGASPSIAGSNVQVGGAAVNCPKIKTKVSSPGVGFQVPNPSKVVPDMGKILRKGLGLPVPNASAPHVKMPKVRAGKQTASCPK